MHPSRQNGIFFTAVAKGLGIDQTAVNPRENLHTTRQRGYFSIIRFARAGPYLAEIPPVLKVTPAGKRLPADFPQWSLPQNRKTMPVEILPLFCVWLPNLVSK